VALLVGVAVCVTEGVIVAVGVCVAVWVMVGEMVTVGEGVENKTFNTTPLSSDIWESVSVAKTFQFPVTAGAKLKLHVRFWASATAIPEAKISDCPARFSLALAMLPRSS
jgi:hypothetical protein